ncbi:hypothetical protein N7517_009751 [Penicillium concentricum]|uniref:Uncharacterized protein n=1 Tax=Penicillium concentricum TaxID=293559 RepID=A0A9W9RI06_9EURO|nr:uncharacterized protein N7517_009751 [Penicillium concentricum]KAJ5360560.1 hypothetical protein N7517_009751 [Penicillium concentricum]
MSSPNESRRPMTSNHPNEQHSLSTHESEIKAQTSQTTDDTIHFKPSIYVSVLVFLYTGCMVASWSIICSSSRHPVVQPPEASHDNTQLEPDKLPIDAQNLIKSINRWNRTARVLRTISSVFTLPLASAVCSSRLLATHRPKDIVPDVSL